MFRSVLFQPFRSPHHTISDAGLIGGGVHPRPGEVSLAHNSVLSKISGPLLDRIDIQVEVPAVPYKDLRREGDAESSEDIRNRVTVARTIQSERFARTKIHANAQMSSRHIKKYCKIDDDSAALLESAIDKLGLSARAYNRILKIARTIADLSGVADIGSSHITEAIQYRTLDRGKSPL